MQKNLLSFLTLGLLLVSAGCSDDNTNSNNKNSDSSSTVVTPSSSVDTREYYSEVYSNPLMVTTNTGGNYNGEIADPSVVRGDNGYYYIVATNRVLLRSEDTVNWEVVTGNIIDVPAWGKEVVDESYGLWAPDLIKIGDKWIYYYSLSGWGAPVGIGYATADDVEGPYTDQGKLFDLNEIGIQNCIDPQPFVDVDGSVYMTVGSFQGLYLVELTEDGTACLNGVEYQKENKVLVAGYPGGWDGSTYEGGYIMRKDDKYYYFGSAGTCCEGQSSTYRVYVGVADNVAGPYRGKDNRPLTLSGNGTTCGELVLWAGAAGVEKEVVGPGHNSILVDDAGDWWMYYHAFSNLDKFGTRHLFMDKIEWDEDGFPYVETKKPSFQEEKDGPRILIEE